MIHLSHEHSVLQVDRAWVERKPAASGPCTAQ